MRSRPNVSLPMHIYCKSQDQDLMSVKHITMRVCLVFTLPSLAIFAVSDLVPKLEKSMQLRALQK